MGFGALGHLDELHRDDEVSVLFYANYHDARALGVVHESALGEGHFYGCVHLVLRLKLIEVHRVRVRVLVYDSIG